MAQLDVYLNTACVGHLRQEQGRIHFTYRDTYLSTMGAVPLSKHLPLHEGPFDETATLAFFANLLPEGAVLDQVARQLGRSRDNVFGLLEALGGDCAGAVTILPPGQQPKPTGNYRRVTEDELSTILAELPTHPLLADSEGIRLSLAGAQNKLPVFRDATGFLVPEGDAASSHILKTAIPGLENTVANEAFCMGLARKIGLPAPSAQVVTIGTERVFIIERYDRSRQPSGEIARVHQEDFCQALGVIPALKYEAEGGPGFAAIFALVRAWSTEPLLDTDLLLQWALFNFLIGNADAHGKNLSFLYQSGTIRLAPFYDLICTAAYERQVNNKFAMRMGTQKDPRYLSVQDLEEFAAQIGVANRVVFNELKQLIRKIETNFEEMASVFETDPINRVIISRIRQVVSGRTGKAKYLCKVD